MENRIFTVSLVYSFIFFRGQRSVVCGHIMQSINSLFFGLWSCTAVSGQRSVVCGQIMQSINSLFFGLWSCTAVSGLPSAVSGLLLDS
jgi:hypothetical protein